MWIYLTEPFFSRYLSDKWRLSCSHGLPSCQEKNRTLPPEAWPSYIPDGINRFPDDSSLFELQNETANSIEPSYVT